MIENESLVRFRRGAAIPSGILLGLVALAAAGCSGGSSASSAGSNTTGPRMTAAEYVDVDGNGVDSGDILVITFETAVRILSTSANSFDFDSALDAFGAGSTLSQSIPNSDRVEITLGAGTDFVPDVSTMDVRTGTNLNVTNLAGDDARVTTATITVEDITALPPTLVSSSAIDADQDGVIGEGDQVLCAFDKPIAIPVGATFAANFALPVTGDSCGTTPSLSAFSPAAANRGVLIALDATPTLTVTGTFDGAILTAGSPSGIAMSATPTITDTLASSPNAVTASTQVDLATTIESYFRTGQEGSLFVGNTDGSSPDVGPSGLAAPGGMVHFTGSVIGSPTADIFFIADTRNHRVLAFDGLPAGSNGSATVVLGQPDLSTNLANGSASGSATPTGATMHSPTDVHFHAPTNQLFVCDAGNHRVLVFDDVVDTTTGAIDLVDGQSASRVLGQSGFTGGSANQGSTPSSRSLSSPGGIHVEGTQIAVADTGNHRVLIWNSIPTASNAAASLVLGQSSFVTALADGGLGTIDGSVLESPSDVVLDSTVTVNASSGAVVVADTGNHRVLVWHGTNPASGSAADRVLGQAAFTTSAAGTGLDELDGPQGVEIFPVGSFTSGESIFVCDTNNDRVTVFDFGVSLANGQTAAQAIGMAGVPADDTLNRPARASLSLGTAAFLFVADRLNHRVMQFPVASGTAAGTATAEQGQPSFATAMPNGHTSNQPAAVAFAAGRMIVCDTQNHRVLIYSDTPTAGDPTPDIVIGQTGVFDTEANQGLAAPTAATLREPSGVATDGTRLVIADTGNNRVLVFATIPASSGASADFVLGQSGFTGSAPNAGGISAATLDSPAGVEISGTELIVCDRDNHRVVIWDDITSIANGSAATVVLGQNDFTSRLPNHGDFTAANTLHTPLDAMVAGGVLFVADSMNHRVVAYGSTATSAISASFVIGQNSPTTNAASTGLAGLDTPSGLASDGQRFFIADGGNHRVVVHHTVPATNGRPGHSILGQASTTQDEPNRGAGTPAEGTLFSPRGLFFDGVTLWVCDAGNSRVVRIR